MTTGTILGCLCLQSPYDQPSDDPTAARKHLPPLSFPLNELEKVETGNHVTPYDSTRAQAFDYWHGGRDAEHSKIFVPPRGMGITGFRVGEQTEDNLTKRCIQHLLAMNSNPTEEDRSKSFLDTAFQKVFTRIDERFCLSLDITSSSPKFVIMTRDMPVYFTGFCDNDTTYLLWTNEANIEDRLRAHYKERFYYYRMKPIFNGTCVIQSVYLKKKIESWRYLMNDRLKMMNALEVHLFRRLMTEAQSVNSSAPAATL